MFSSGKKLVGAGGLEPIFGHLRMSLEKQNRLCFFGIYGGHFFVRLPTHRAYLGAVLCILMYFRLPNPAFRLAFNQ